MRKSLLAAAMLSALLSACSERQQLSRPAETDSVFADDADVMSAEAPLERLTTMNIAAEVPSVEEPAAPSVPLPTAASAPNQIAYSYGYGFRIDAESIAKLQERHVALCEKMAPACRIIRTSQSRTDSWDGFGEVEMEVAADRAATLVDALVAPAEELGGTLVSSERQGEDLSDQIIDTEARLKSRLLLRDKLTVILQNNRGSVEELVKAESEVAKVNEEIDAVRSRLENYRGRIRYSDVKIQYEPAFGKTQVGFVRPVAKALRSVGSTLGVSVAAIVYALTALLPVALLLAALRWVLHRFGYRLRFWKRDLRAKKAAEEPAEN